MRLHPRTRELVEVAISDSKPEIADKYLFGLILAERSVIHIIKNDDKLSVGATGKNDSFYIFHRYQHDSELYQCK